MAINKLIKKGQSYSTDILVVVIIILFGALFLVMNKVNDTQNDINLNDKYEKASVDSKIIVDHLKETQIMDSENKVDVNRLLAMDELQLKGELGIKNDFAIVFEKDGKLVKMDPESDVNCIGSSRIVVNGKACQ
ncbi:MAG: hypothetical protein KC550_02785 [Nanoarchaeota archaeon]|nr:hypothetical protein [Nanoarchaeota archaeon]